MRKIIFDFKDIKQEEISENANKRKSEKTTTERIFEYINSIMKNENYGIGLHSVRGKNLDDVSDKIMRNGLEIDDRKKVLSTVSSFGTRKKIDKEYLQKSMMEYSYGQQGEIKQNIIVLVPSIISNSSGEEIYLGFPPYDTECHGNDYRTSSVLDTLCTNEGGKGQIPPEFILGYYSSNNGEVTFVKNPNYITLLSKEQKDEFFSKMKQRLTGKYKEISDAVIAGDVEKLEELSRQEQETIFAQIEAGIKINILERGVNAQVAENLSRSSVQIKQDDSAIQALTYLQRVKEENQLGLQLQTNKRRRILISSYKNVKLSDLTNARETLREGIEEPKREQEGKEV